MDFFYFLVKSSTAWEPRFHENFFVECNAFNYGVLIAVIVALAMAAIFYFGCCNSKDTAAGATLTTWIVFLALSGVLSFFTADWSIIGKPGTVNNTSVFYKYSFYNANNLYYVEQTRGNTNQQFVNELSAKKTQIKSDLDQGKDVRMSYSGTTAVLSLLFFYLFSLLLKGFTRSGKTIPHMWPNKN